MGVIVDLYSSENNEIKRFLNSFYDNNIVVNDNCLKWEYFFENPVESTNIIGTFMDNNENFNINMWVSFDNAFFIRVTDFNSDKIIRYIYERYPY